MTKYCLDTSALIEAWSRSYPPDSFPSLWDRFDLAIDAGDLKCPDEVLRELEKKDDALFGWAKVREGKLFLPIDDEIQLAVAEILGVFPRLVDNRKFRSQADPFVVALARISGRVVVSGEKSALDGASPKIPNVCRHYGIRCIQLLEFIREQHWNF